MTQSEKRGPNLSTITQASEPLNCHPDTLRNWDEKGYLVAVRFGTRRDRRFRREDVMKIVEGRRAKD